VFLTAPIGIKPDHTNTGWGTDWLLYAGITYGFLTHYFYYHGSAPRQSWRHVFWDGLYFSVATETTVGYGDFSPYGASRVVACVQALLGLCVAGLFMSKITTGPSGKTKIIIERMSGAWIEFCDTSGGIRVSLIHVRFMNGLLRYDGVNFTKEGEYLGTFKGSSEPTSSLNGSEIWFDYSNEEGDASVFSTGRTKLCF
jgi:hypothetical protein